MKFSPTVACALISIVLAAGSAYACAVPKPFFSELFEADAIIRGTLTDYEVSKPGDEARLTIENPETLKGNVQNGPLPLHWKRKELPDQWEGSHDVIVALKLKPSADGEEYEVMNGCGVQAIYETDKYRELVMDIIRRSAR
ncbi:hypothetical protein QA648_27465 (plasmid) [Rhizobium sp. CB3171]|uniref:hypothetical protein n=1 Tax=Rhizobium sp. CB3171 TaxID=3039157 RepID=UPI0024B2025D|nr:hypothetical protein [Rhizobium sp. CB3171]WFU04523.1 hypothetical protein QA648_27465 [Rhizobium sp. CB3171]